MLCLYAVSDKVGKGKSKPIQPKKQQLKDIPNKSAALLQILAQISLILLLSETTKF